MPRFHFNSIRADAVTSDAEGEELPDIAAARNEALASARETLANAIRSNGDPPDRIQVTDSAGTEVLNVELTDLLPKSMRK